MKKKAITVKRLTTNDFPPSVSPFWENVMGGDTTKIAITLTAIVCYCALSPRLRVKYVYDFAQSMLLLNLLYIMKSGGGKSIVRYIVTKLMAPLITRDGEERRIMREYKESKKRKGSNKDKGEEPLVSIRFLQKFTLPVIVKYADLSYRRYGDWLSFFLYGDELGSFTENKRQSGEFQSVSRSAYSLGEMYMRDTLYDDGYNAIVDVCWCSVMCGQEQALEKYINKDGVVQGDAGRQILVKPDDAIGEDADYVKPFTEEQDRDINSAVARLMSETYAYDNQLMPTHEVDMSWMDKDVRQWCGQTRDVILQTGSRAMDSFYVRASVSAFRIATMLYHLWGEEKQSREKVRRCYFFFAQFILDSAMAQWGKDYESALPKDNEATGKRPSLYDLMPKRWTRDQLRDMVVKEELGTPARTFIFKWLKKKWIYEVEKDVYEKIYDNGKE